jgi:hypothetical protein
MKHALHDKYKIRVFVALFFFFGHKCLEWTRINQPPCEFSLIMHSACYCLFSLLLSLSNLLVSLSNHDFDFLMLLHHLRQKFVGHFSIVEITSAEKIHRHLIFYNEKPAAGLVPDKDKSFRRRNDQRFFQNIQYF